MVDGPRFTDTVISRVFVAGIFYRLETRDSYQPGFRISVKSFERGRLLYMELNHRTVHVLGDNRCFALDWTGHPPATVHAPTNAPTVTDAFVQSQGRRLGAALFAAVAWRTLSRRIALHQQVEVGVELKGGGH